MTAIIETYRRRDGTNAELGHEFERDVMCLTYVRCLKLHKMNKLKEFKIASNMDFVGAFDDIVCRIEYEENSSSKTRLIFIQTKHKENPVKHAFSDETLTPPRKSKKSDKPPIHEYIKSYLKIHKIFLKNGQCEKFTDKDKSTEESKKIIESLRNAFQCKLEDAQFVYYTNATEGEMQYFEKIQNADIVTEILDTRFIGVMYKFRLNKTELFDMFPELCKTLSQKEIDSVQQFLNNFFVYVCQESGQSLEEIIKKDISCCMSYKSSDLDTLCKIFFYEMKINLQSEYIPFLTEKINCIDKIYSLIKLQSQTMIEREKYNQLSKIFSDETIKQLYDDIMKQKFIKIQYRDKLKSIAFIKCLQLAENMEEINKSFLFLYIREGFFETWQEVRNLHSYTKFSENLVCLDNVPIAEVHRVCSSEVRTTELIAIISYINHATNPLLWKQLSPLGIEHTMNCNVTFQGVFSTLRDIVGDVYFREIIDKTDDRNFFESLFCRFLDNEVVNIGNSLPVMEEIYIERRYKLNATYLKLEALNEDRDSFLIFPKQNMAISVNVESLKNVLIFENEQNARMKFYSCVDKNKNTHLCYVNTSLMVIVSHGSMLNIIKYKTNSGNADMNEELSEHLVCPEVLADVCASSFTETCHCRKFGCKRAVPVIKMSNEPVVASDSDEESVGACIYPQWPAASRGRLQYGQQLQSVGGLTASSLPALPQLGHYQTDTPEPTGCERNEYDMNEKTFLQYTMKNKCTFISDDVGMGKSTALKRLCHYIKTRCKVEWVEYINLSLQDKNLKNVKGDTNPIYAVLHLLNLNELDRIIFLHKCSTDGKVALMFDGFDEISHESRENFHHLVKALSKTKINTIVVATRPNVEKELKNNLLSFHFNIICFSYYDMNSYIMKCWSKNVEKKDKEQLKKLVQNIVDQAKAMKGILRDIIAVPLQTKMLAETYDLKIKQILLSEESFQKFELPSLNLFRLYDNFIDMHIDRCIKEKFEISDANTSNFEFFKIALFKKNSGIWESIACKEMFPSNKICEVTDVSDIDELAKQRIGIFVKSDLGKVTFVHRSFAEFLAAKYVSRLVYESKNTEHLNFIYQTICVDKTLSVFRKFMNSIYENEKHWETAEINFVPNLLVDENILIRTVIEGNAFLFKAILRHLTKNEDVLIRILNKKEKNNESTSLHFSAQYCEQVFDDILNSNFFDCAKDVNFFNRTALNVACEYGRKNSVVTYLNKFQDESLSAILNQMDASKETPLLSAAKNGHTDIIKILQHHGTSIHNKNMDGKNALMFASHGGCIETVEYLLGQSAHINETDDEMRTAIIWACQGLNKWEYFRRDEDLKRYEACVDVIRLLLEHKADVDLQNYKGRTALMLLAEHDINIDNVKCLIHYGTDIKAVDLEGRTAVMIAAMNGSTEIVKYLLESGEDIVNQVDGNGNTGLILRSGNFDDPLMLQYLLEIGSNLDQKNNDGDTALIAASSSNKFRNVKFLTDYGANVNICNKKGDSALICASRTFSSSYETLSYLLEQKAQINFRNHDGNTALHFAAFKYDLQDIKVLVENGADIHLKNNDGITPVMKALENKRENVIAYFQELINTRASSMHLT